MDKEEVKISSINKMFIHTLKKTGKMPNYYNIKILGPTANDSNKIL